MTNVVQFVVQSIPNVTYQDFVAKFENDPITQVIMDSKEVFSTDIIYGKLLGWFYLNFKPLVDMHPILMGMLRDKNTYLNQMLMLFIPTVHRRFFESTIYDATSQKILEIALQELNIDATAVKAAAKREVQLVW